MGLGYDDGTVLIKIGREEPVASMDASGKIIWARQNEVQTANVKALGSDFNEVGQPMLPGCPAFLQEVHCPCTYSQAEGVSGCA